MIDFHLFKEKGHDRYFYSKNEHLFASCPILYKKMNMKNKLLFDKTKPYNALPLLPLSPEVIPNRDSDQPYDR